MVTGKQRNDCRCAMHVNDAHVNHAYVTPDGHGDCIRVVNREHMFVMPKCREMTMQDLREGLRKQQQPVRRGDVPYKKMYENGLKTFDDGDDDDGESQRIGRDDDEVLYYSRQVRTEEVGECSCYATTLKKTCLSPPHVRMMNPFLTILFVHMFFCRMTAYEADCNRSRNANCSQKTYHLPMKH